jgi:hypothetical protein
MFHAYNSFPGTAVCPDIMLVKGTCKLSPLSKISARGDRRFRAGFFDDPIHCSANRSSVPISEHNDCWKANEQ